MNCFQLRWREVTSETYRGWITKTRSFLTVSKGYVWVAECHSSDQLTNVTYWIYESNNTAAKPTTWDKCLDAQPGGKKASVSIENTTSAYSRINKLTWKFLFPYPSWSVNKHLQGLLPVSSLDLYIFPRTASSRTHKASMERNCDQFSDRIFVSICTDYWGISQLTKDERTFFIYWSKLWAWAAKIYDRIFLK